MVSTSTLPNYFEANPPYLISFIINTIDCYKDIKTILLFLTFIYFVCVRTCSHTYAYFTAQHKLKPFIRLFAVERSKICSAINQFDSNVIF